MNLESANWAFLYHHLPTLLPLSANLIRAKNAAKLTIKEKLGGRGVDTDSLTQGMCLVKGLQRCNSMLFWVQIS